MTQVDCFQKNKYVIKFTTNNMIYKFEANADHNMDILYLT